MTEDTGAVLNGVRELLQRKLKPETFNLVKGEPRIAMERRGCTITIPTGATSDRYTTRPEHVDAIYLQLVRDQKGKAYWSVDIRVVYPTQEEKMRQLRRIISGVLRGTDYSYKFENESGGKRVIL